MRCERCATPSTGFQLHDYCGVCGKNLCNDCMTNGCCGNVPAISGQANDHSDDSDDFDGGDRRDGADDDFENEEFYVD